MENLAQLAPAIILIPAIGAIINFFWGARLGEGVSAMVGSVASALSFVVAALLFIYLVNSNFEPLIINPPLLDSWIRIDSIGLDITWQTRVDTLSVAMMLFVTFVGTLIHIYAAGYMHGDPRFSSFFAYLNMFLAFMLILVTANNFLMMFVGWEGVGLCSYLLIGFWWDKPNGEGWKNSNAARKAFIVNRIGDLGVLMAMFLIVWTFGTLDFFKPGEINNVNLAERIAAGVDAHDEAEADNSEHNDEVITPLAGGLSYRDPAVEPHQLGVFGQTQRLLMVQQQTGEEAIIDYGNFTLSLETALVLITLFMLLGAAGKSAQIPLFVWLPDAMAGPTPVSALIHAATMVTAGVYMMVRANVFFGNADFTSFIVTLVGAATALTAGFIAIGQFDIKRVLAYSTISQLGFMVAAVGIGAYAAAMFHMITHAFFKALLFLGSGSVIHGVEHGHHHTEHAHSHEHDSEDVQREHVHGYGEETLGDHKPEVSPGGPTDPLDPQDMRNMGGLRSRMPVTYWTYLIGTLALAGIYPFAGFWSKDEILADSWVVGFIDGKLAGYLALGFLMMAAGFTAFYMWRQIEMVFHGRPRTEAAEHAPESSPSMTIPLVILAFFSLFIGFINIPSGIASIFTFGLDRVFNRHSLADFLEYSIAKFHDLPPFNPLIALTALAIGIGAIFFARSIYGGDKAVTRGRRDPLEVNPSAGSIWSLANARLYWDEIYFRLIENPFNKMAAFLADVIDWAFLHNYFHDTLIVRGFNTFGKLLSRGFDLGIIDGTVNGVGWLVQRISGGLRRTQTGYVRTYALVLLLGVVAVLIIMLLPLIQIG
jgi:NADH-quinone oxidoreductase subunit L